MNELTIQLTAQIAVAMEKGETARISKQLPNGNVAILQVVDPERIPRLQKILRAKRDTSYLARVLHSLLASVNVAKIVFNNAMKNEKIYQKKRKQKTPAPKKDYRQFVKAR